ncbi:amino acid adenylation domain-containing protein [Streptomyces sp. NPDC059900]|uniref:amino acid adenylation domain-containing protein n=1 Tax=Streptomyces sp. NPDC059900 TaxID=3155816 RepID=UPI00343B3F0C
MTKAGYVEPRAGAEQLVAMMMADVLGCERVGRHDDFFKIGGHSLPAVRLVARARELFGVDLPVKLLFDAPTAAEFAAQVARGSSISRRPLGRASHGPKAPVSSAQRRLWFLQELETDSTAYHMGESFRIEGPLDLSALTTAVAALAQRHESLRTRFSVADGVPVQSVDEQWSGALELIEAPGEPTRGEEECAAAIADFCRRMHADPFDLGRGPLFRARLLRLGPQDHVLSLAMHHIVCDGWSMTLLLEELGGLYEAALTGRAAAPAPDGVRYRDFAAWQQKELTGPALQELLDYWTAHIEGAPTLLEFATPREDAAGPRSEGEVRFTLSPEVTQALRDLSRACGATMFMSLLAVFEILMSRYSGERDLLVGTLVSGRTHPEVEGVVGFFVNMLALRADLRDDPDFTGLVGRVREVVLDGFAHQDLPFERLVEAANPERTSGMPLVQSAFQYFEDDSARSPLRLSGVRDVHAVNPPGREDPDLPLAMDLHRHGDELRGLFTYDRALLSPAEAQWLVRSFVTLAAEVVADPGRPVSRLPLVGPAHVAEVLALGAGPEVPVTDRSVLDALWRQVGATPDKAAVTDAEGTWTFAELGRAVRGVASEVAAHGPVVAVAGQRSRLMVAALLGVWQAGAAAVPLELGDPSERLRSVLAASGASALLCDATAAGLGSGAGLPVIGIAEAVTAPAMAPASGAQGGGPAPDDLALMLFTSGTTGKPKGISLEHGGLANLLAAHREAGRHADTDRRVAWTASFAFDATIDQFLWLLAGHELHVAGDDTRRDPHALLDFVRDARIDVLDVPPAQLPQLLDIGLLDEQAAHRPDLLLLGGDAIPTPLWQRLRATPGVTAWNLYGPTECTIDALAWPLENSETPLIGRPVANTHVRVLDAAGQLLPPGVAGELYLSGAHVGRGYLDLPDETEARFLPDPFTDRPGARMYRTGDRGSCTADGAVRFLGRLDRQVKVRGHRVELSEVEAAVLAHPGVRQSVVVHHDGALTAYLSPAAGDGQIGELREALAVRLPAAMVPTAFVTLATLPLLPSGKVDVRSLPTADEVSATAFAAPRPGAEELVAQVMAEVLGLDRVGRDDDFFKIGGHSLRAGRVVSRVRRLFGTEVSVRTLFDAPTVAEFAAAVERGTRPERRPLARTAHGPATAVSYAQARLWFMHELDPESTAYHMGESFRLTGALDHAALTAAVAGLAEGHESLRTRFDVADDGPVQIVDERWSGTLEQHEAEAAPGPGQDAAVTDFCRRMLEDPYDLENGPLFRARLLRLGPQDHVLSLGMHHIVCDGWSMTLLLEELAEHYEAAVLGRAHLPQPLPVRYRDFSAWQHSELAGPALAELLAYWTAHIEGAPTHLPALGAQPDGTEPGTRTVEFALSPDVTRDLRALSRTSGATLFMTLLAVFEVLVSRVSGERDLLVGVPVAGRTHPEVEGVVGFFVNMLALRADLRDDPDFTDLVGRVRDVVLGGFAHQDLPFELLVEAVNPERDLGLQPLLQATFQLFEEEIDAGFALRGLKSAPVDISSSAPRFDLSLDMFRAGEGLRGWFHCNGAVFTERQTALLAEAFTRLAAEVAGDAARRLSDLPELLELPELKDSKGSKDSKDLTDPGTPGAAQGVPEQPAAVLMGQS